MPVAHINVLSGHPRPVLQQLIAEVSETFASIIGAPKERLEVWVTEIDPELWGGDVEIPFVEMVLLEGRPKEQHHDLIAEITTVIERVLGTAPGRVRIHIAEVSPDRWGIGGVSAAIARAAEIEARAAPQ
jgi:4-oxalocrotonate tautomerase family enzyme